MTRQCVVCGRPEKWTGPDPANGRVQGWWLRFTTTDKGPMCEQRAKCERVTAERAPTLFEL